MKYDVASCSTSLCALPGSLLAGTSGFVIKHVGFVDFFIGTSLLGIPVALLAWYVLHKHGMATWTAQTDDAESTTAAVAGGN